MSFDSQLYNQKKDEYFSYERGDMLKFIPPGVTSVLDVGCSSGLFGKLIKEKYNCIVWGIEPTDAADIASKNLDKVYKDIFHPLLDLGNMKFDVIVFNDVLEHLSDPWQTLKLSRSYLNKNGRIVASIPNVQCYTVVKELITKGNWTYESSGILDKTHLRFFTRNSIVEMFNQEGFDIDRIEGMNSVVPYSRLLRILNFLFPRKIRPFNFISYGLITKPVENNHA